MGPDSSHRNDVLLREETSIPLMSKREFVHGSPRRIGDELCRFCFPGPRNLRDVLYKISGKIIFHVTDLCPTHGMTPANVPRDCPFDRRAVGQCIDDIVVVFDVNITRLKRSFASCEVYGNSSSRFFAVGNVRPLRIIALEATRLCLKGFHKRIGTQARSIRRSLGRQSH